MVHEPGEPPDLPRVRFGVRYRFADYRAFVLDHLATRAPRMNPFARSLAAWASFAAFVVKNQRLGACSFVIDASGLVRTGAGGSAQVPWTDVAAVHRYRAGYLLETRAGAMPLPYRALDTAQRAALETLFDWHERALARSRPDASLSILPPSSR